jgi:hypothetical protein
VFKGEFQISRRKFISNGEKEVDTRQMIGPTKSQVNNKVYSLGKKANFIDLVLALESKGQTLGFEDGLFERNYTTSIKCNSNEGILFKVRCDDFFAKI